MADKSKPAAPVRATTHPGDTRSNISTAELEDDADPAVLSVKARS